MYHYTFYNATLESCTVPITAAIVVPVIIFIIAALTVFILLMVCGRQHKSKCKTLYFTAKLYLGYIQCITCNGN